MSTDQLFAELARLDAAGDHAGAAAALVAAGLAAPDAAFAVYRLIAEGRFRSAQLAARALVAGGVDHPVLGFARAVGGTLFEDPADAEPAGAALLQTIAQFAPNQRQMFEDQVLIRAFLNAMNLESVTRDPAREVRLRRFFASLSTRFAGPDRKTALPGIVFPDPIDAALSPFWLGAESLETLTFVRTSPHAPPQARTLFRPERVLRLTSATRDVLYEPDNDYRLDPDTGFVTLPPGSRVPFKTMAELIAFAPIRLPFAMDDPRSFHFVQAEIAYTHAAGQWHGPTPAIAEAYLPVSLAKLRARTPFKLMVLADSIGEGAGASKGLKLAPDLPGFVELVAQGLERAYRVRPALENLSRGGWAAQSGAQLAIGERLGTRGPDLVLVAFGMNDITFANSGYDGVYSAANYGLRVAAIIEAIRQDAHDAEFLLISPMFGNGENALFPPAQFAAYRDELQRLTGRGVALADVTGVLDTMLKTKSWYDTTMNGINHPNDFMHGIYAQIVLACLVPAKA